jgi:arylsulfatase A-like enzyme
MISFLDEQVGIIMRKIKALGLDENTIIMFSSDNGATFSAGVDSKFFNSVSGFRGLKMEVYEGGIRVPFIARWPGKIKENTTSDLLSVQYDIMPTLADLTGKPLKDMDGVSILPTLLSKQVPQTKHEFMYFEYPENGGQIALRLGNWKGVQMNVRKNPPPMSKSRSAKRRPSMPTLQSGTEHLQQYEPIQAPDPRGGDIRRPTRESNESRLVHPPGLRIEIRLGDSDGSG